ncbi:DUF1569 domain-containing protein [Algisphaera agarilytica]|uniref:DUF1569 domain-containing protein n=1 Tax=Algisphaera agarilytica TaxID=1385975 RepID=A0A7X0LJI8_9BACT|nr:DUF1569 domain-containing protein [Algisphaera agarilytica]MBB6428656.1 hypothetical protein [Algisphaera agarilytica]
MAVDVKQADRRELHFDSLDEVLAEAQTFTEQSTSTGNWSPAQNIYHVAFAIGMLNHGVDLKIPLPMKLFGRTLKLFGAHVKPFNPGIKPPQKVADAFAPPADVTLADAVQKLRDEVAYANEHGMNHPSPLFGKLTPDEAIKLNCRHAELHFGFIHPAAS